MKITIPSSGNKIHNLNNHNNKTKKDYYSRTEFDEDTMLPKYSTETLYYRNSNFRARIVVFSMCYTILTLFVFSSFFLGNNNGESIINISKLVVNKTIVPFFEIISNFILSYHIRSILNGLSRLVTMNIMSIFVAIFIISVFISVTVSLFLDIFTMVRNNKEQGNVLMMSGYQQRYQMYEKLQNKTGMR